MGIGDVIRAVAILTVEKVGIWSGFVANSFCGIGLASLFNYSSN